MSRTINLSLSCALLAVLTAGPQVSPAYEAQMPWRSVLMSADQTSLDALMELRSEGIQAIVLPLEDGDQSARVALAAAAQRIEQAKLELHYWIEIARNSHFADEHPEWMASIQGHHEWRRLYPDFAMPRETEVVKVYPWVPVLYREAFDAHTERIKTLLSSAPAAKVIYLNDLQGAPSACGCGNTQCRWTTDYGPIKTATRLGDEAAANFVDAVQNIAPRAEIVPVWVTECEEHDGKHDGYCAGVGCFNGDCWRTFSKQLAPVLVNTSQLALLLPLKDFGRDTKDYDQPAGWTAHACSLMIEKYEKHAGERLSKERLIAVVQAWDVTPEQIELQIMQAQKAGVRGIVVAKWKIDQSWSPRLVPVR